MPIIGVGLEELPEALWAGEGRMSTLTLTNTSQVALAELKGLCSHPSISLFTEDGESPYTVGAFSTTPAGSSTVSNCLLPNTPTTIKLSNSALQPGKSIKVPLLCRGDAVGHHTLRWLFTFHGVVSAVCLYDWLRLTALTR